jgi:hypothetical protein
MSDSNSEQQTNQYDQRKVETNNVGAGAVLARDGSAITFNSIDPGAFTLGGQAVTGSLDLAKTIAQLLGTSLNTFGHSATNSVDGLIDLVGQVGSGVQGQSKSTNYILLIALAGAFLVAYGAVSRK